MKRISLSLMALLVSMATGIAGCSDTDDTPETRPETYPVATTFAKGADVGWLTQLESEGHKFYDASGNEKELMQLLRDDVGVNSIRPACGGSIPPTDGTASRT